MLKICIAFASVLIGLALAFWINEIAGDEMIMAIVGTVCGIVAAIPVLILVLAALAKDRSTYQPMPTPSEPPAVAPWTITKPAPQALPDRTRAN